MTALFVDVVGSTSLAEQMDPEDWAATMERAMVVMSGAVERYDGWVANHTGDGFMALFGLPTAHEDDPARAVSAALEMVKAVDELAEAQRPSVELKVRVGVNTGEVVARDAAGIGTTADPRLYGDALNVAARLQSEAPPGGILITGETHAFLGDRIESRYLGPIEVKGKAAPVEAYEVLGRMGALRSVRGLAGLHSPMVGRDEELARLRAGLAPTRGGVGRMAVVEGEPGMGKSRLLRELRAAAEADGLGWVEARTVSYGRERPFHLAIDLVRALVELPDPLESLPPTEAAAHLTEQVGALLATKDGEAGAMLSHLLSLPTDDVATERLSHMQPQTLRLRYTEALTELVAATARRRPTVMVCDDLHWADDASVDVLLPLVTRLRDSPVLWVLASRSERDVPGRRLIGAADEVFGEALVRLRLRALAAEDVGRLVANLLEIATLPSTARDLILERAEGNPLFVEEIIRMLIDREAIEYRDGRWLATDKVLGVEVPDTLQGLLLARIDGLPAASRRLLHVASVIGRTFAVRVLARVSADPSGDESMPDGAEPASADAGTTGIGAELSVLEGTGLIGVATSEPELEYSFRHALIGDAAYASLLKQDRRSLHLRVAEALLAVYPDHDAEIAAELAHHFERAEEHPRAIAYLSLAARYAASRYARREALQLARRALALLPAGDEAETAERRQRADLRFLAAEAAVASVPMRESLAALQGVIADAEALGDIPLAARAWLLVGRARGMAGEQYRSSPELTAALDRATELAEASGSDVLKTRALLARGQVRFTASEFPEAIELMEGAIPALAEAGQYFEASVAAWQLGTAYGHVGDFERAVEWTDRSYELGLESGDPNATLDADLGRAMVEALRGDTAAAIDYASRAAGVAEQVDNKACALVAHSVIGEQHLRDGDAAQAAIAFEASADLATFCQFMPVRIEQTELLLQTARARGGVGSVEFERYERALELARQFGDRLAEAQLYEQRAGDRVAAGQGEAVGDDLGRAESLFEDLGASADLERVRQLQESLST